MEGIKQAVATGPAHTDADFVSGGVGLNLQLNSSENKLICAISKYCEFSIKSIIKKNMKHPARV